MMPDIHPAFRTPPFPFEKGTHETFEDAVYDAAERSRVSLDALHEVVRKCVADLKKREMTPEAVLITMKAYFRHTAKSHYKVTDRSPQWMLDTLAEELSMWCIDEYYRASSD